MQQKKYGTKDWPVLVTVYHVLEFTGRHRLVTINDAFTDDLGGITEFEKLLKKQFAFFEALGSLNTYCVGADDGNWVTDDGNWVIDEPRALHERMSAIRFRYPGITPPEPWMSEGDKAESESIAELLQERQLMISELNSTGTIK
jgi:hypothetical protein